MAVLDLQGMEEPIVEHFHSGASKGCSDVSLLLC